MVHLVTPSHWRSLVQLETPSPFSDLFHPPTLLSLLSSLISSPHKKKITELQLQFKYSLHCHQ